MSEYNVKSYTEQGGGVAHIGGKLIIEEGGEVEGFDGGGGSSYTLPTASADTLGGVKAKAKSDEIVKVAVDTDGTLYVPAVPQAETQADSTASDAETLKTDLNSLLAKLKAAGLMKSE